MKNEEKKEPQPKVLKGIMLRADSPARAWYKLQIIEIPGGYVIEKRSGRQGSAGIVECWFRWSLPEAEKFFTQIFNEKTRCNRKRVYVLVPDELMMAG